MGIESDQLVYDYLSRVGDMAQQQQLPSGARMRLVSTLRNEIDRQRGKFGSDSPAAVRRILGRLGDPEVVVRTASTDDVRAPLPPEPPRPVVPEQRAKRSAPRSRRVKEPEGQPEIPDQASGSPGDTGLSGSQFTMTEDLTRSAPSGAEPDWWRVDSGPMGGVGPMGPESGLGVPGFVGGVDIPEMYKIPKQEKPEKAAEAERDDAPEAVALEKGGGRRWRPRLRRRDDESRSVGLTNPFLLLAAALLVAGAFLGSWLALGGGWLLAYASRTLSRAEAKWAVFGLPGVSAAGGLVWLWGRMNGRWGEAIPKDGMGPALQDTWPVVVRTAAVASALYLVWRSRRRRN